ncbi:MAG: YutD family protein [Lactobacillales bacterium]|jgi:uncharacterized protein YutD|nr:YutD family protein [Lactobacillales bacterium]
MTKPTEEVFISEEARVLDEVLKEEVPRIRWISANEIQVDEKFTFKIVHNHRDAFAIEQFIKRFSDILLEYDYVVGDLGYDLLRMRGFYNNDRKNVAADQKIVSLQDYIYEFCNFGCPFFVLELANPRPRKPYKGGGGNSKNKNRNRNNNNRKNNDNRNRDNRDFKKKGDNFKKKNNDNRPKAQNQSKPKPKPATKKKSFVIREK